MKYCLVIPAYNEENRIAPRLDNVMDEFVKAYGTDCKVVVVSESKDKTDQIVREYEKKCENIILYNPNSTERLFKGGVVREAFKYACKTYDPEFIGFVDADMSVSGSEMVRMFTELQKQNCDGLIGSRYMKGSKLIGKRSTSRNVASRFFNGIVRVLFGMDYLDTQCGAKVFKGESLKSVLHLLILKDWTFDVNLLYEMKLAKYDVREMPLEYVVVETDSKVRTFTQAPSFAIVSFGYRIYKSWLGKYIPRSLMRSIYLWSIGE